MKKNKIISAFLFFFAGILIPCFGDYPRIDSLRENDPIFKQITADITRSYKRTSLGKEFVPLAIYIYRPYADESFFAIASRFNLPYESISTLNRISSVLEFDNSKDLLIPNQPILFIPRNPDSDIEVLLNSRDDLTNTEISIILPDNSLSKFYYIPDGRFNSTERAFFLSTFFRFPIDRGVITSSYGMRKSPISGSNLFHRGIDIAAPEGSPVFASGKGTVTANSYNEVLGNYIMIKHPGTYYTIYGHLKKSFVNLNNNVNAGTIIGEVGSTGYSTGPHLHFEVKTGDITRDPLTLFSRKQ